MKINTDISKNYMNAIQALEDEGFQHIGVIKMKVNNKETIKPLLKKAGIQYYYIGMDHFNTTIYSVKVGRVDRLKINYSTF